MLDMVTSIVLTMPGRVDKEEQHMSALNYFLWQRKESPISIPRPDEENMSLNNYIR
jgi:hypothetical protein